KPFLKWAGGKTQLIAQLMRYFPACLQTGGIHRYVEPLVGSGAVFFHVANHYPVREFYIADVNAELILAYQTVRDHADALIRVLQKLERRYLRLAPAARKEFFYATRARFNAAKPHINYASEQPSWVERTTQIIFLNRTCFNGLFRVNTHGEFNVPCGDYNNPRICDADNLRAVSDLLQRATIACADFTACQALVDDRTLVYFDPPYRPLSQTASFTAYSPYAFDEPAQIRLANFFRRLDAQGGQLVLSNSDPQNTDAADRFFERHYAGFHIHRVFAARMINSDAAKRGKVSELVITNFGDV
ncbi:MAG: DNA adenine methylase, partial [Chloroflexota bacterium]